MKKNFKEMQEYVMVFKTALLHKIGHFQGLKYDLSKYLNVILDNNNHKFMNRNLAESDNNYKQLIPYVLLSYGQQFFSYRRGKLQGEKKLRGNYSIGVGGHISVKDPTLFGTTYEDGLTREVNEEIQIGCAYENKVVALINDDSNSVGQVHFGIVHLFTLQNPIVRPKEKSINEARFVSTIELKGEIDKFENWSKICINNIEKFL